MSDSKFVDPRLQARESLFQSLHLSIFDTIGYASSIQASVEENGHDISANNPDFLQLLRDYEVTKHLSNIALTELDPLRTETDSILAQGKHARANSAQLCAAATNALNYWRILDEIPADLQDNEIVTKSLKAKFQSQLHTWNYIIKDLNNSTA